jgi:hypothetical protein
VACLWNDRWRVLGLKSCVFARLIWCMWFTLTRQQQQSGLLVVWTKRTVTYLVQLGIPLWGGEASGGYLVLQVSHLSCGRPCSSWRLNNLIGAAAVIRY